MVLQKDFDDTISRFKKLEKRGSFYPMFLNLIEKDFKVEAFLFILATWNFASFRYAMKEFDVNGFKNTIKKLNPYFNKFKNKDFKKINFDDYKKDIIYIFDTLSEIKGIQATGSSKLIHLTTPSVFVMWDGYIRKQYGFINGNSEDYFNFLKKMQKEFNNIKFVNKNRTFTKAIDEFNYVKITLPQLERKKNKVI
jgi:hypothetical protein